MWSPWPSGSGLPQGVGISTHLRPLETLLRLRGPVESQAANQGAGDPSSAAPPLSLPAPPSPPLPRLSHVAGQCGLDPGGHRCPELAAEAGPGLLPGRGHRWPASPEGVVVLILRSPDIKNLAFSTLSPPLEAREVGVGISQLLRDGVSPGNPQNARLLPPPLRLFSVLFFYQLGSILLGYSERLTSLGSNRPTGCL